MSWQDSFIPENSQTSSSPSTQGWQTSFVPDNQANDNESDVSYMDAIQQYLIDKPGTTYGNILPFSQNDQTGETSLDLPQIARSPARGLAELLARSGGQLPDATDNPMDIGRETLSPDALGALVLLSPTSPALSKKLAPSIKADSESDGGDTNNPSLISPKSGDIKLIKEKLEMAGVTPQQYADALANSSPDDFAGELGGDPLRMQTQAQAKVTGPSMQEARDAMRQRLQTAPQRVQNLIEQAFYPSSSAEPVVGADTGLMKGAPSPIKPVEQAQQNLIDIKNKLPDLYDAADKSTVTRRASLGVINTPAGQQAMKDTVTKLANQGISPQDAGIIIDPNNGFHGLSTEVPVPTLHELSKSLGDQVARNPLTGAIEDSKSLVIEGLRKHITSYLAENSPEFNAANTNAAAQMQGESAFQSGRKLAHSAAGENADALLQRADDTFSPQELSHQKAGYVQGLADMLEGNPLGGGNPASRIAKGTVQNTSSTILQSPSEAQKFAEALMQEKNRIDLAQRGLFGSNTAETLTAGLPEVPTSLHGVAMKGVSKVADFLQAGKNERLAQLLYATSPDQKALLAKMVLGK